MVLPSLARLSIARAAETGASDAKRKLEGSEDGDEGSSKAAKDTDAKRLLAILHALPSLSVARAQDTEPEWVYELSNDQFDMLLSLRLYTGSLYRLMTTVLDPNHVRDVQSSTKRTLEAVLELGEAEADNPSRLLYVALVNARRRMVTRGPSPLFVEELDETEPINMTEHEFRKFVAILLTSYRACRKPNTYHYVPCKSSIVSPACMLNKFTDRASGKGEHWDSLARSPTRAKKKEEQIADASRGELWAAIRHTALALQTLIIESHVVVGNDPVPVYRGMKDETHLDQLGNSFVSVSREEEVARRFTTSYELTVPNQCCMMRISLLEMTPYLDVDMALKNTNGWGFAIGEKELILPPGLNWYVVHFSPAEFPWEIEEDEDYYLVKYYTTGPRDVRALERAPDPVSLVHEARF